MAATSSGCSQMHFAMSLGVSPSRPAFLEFGKIGKWARAPRDVFEQAEQRLTNRGYKTVAHARHVDEALALILSDQ
jgi:hypothetical protein